MMHKVSDGEGYDYDTWQCYGCNASFTIELMVKEGKDEHKEDPKFCPNCGQQRGM